MTMHIRQATQEDAEEISKLISSVAHFFTAEPDGRGAERFMLSITPDAIHNNLCDPCFHYLCAFHGSTLAGVAALREGRHLFHLFVSPTFQRLGLARQLWLALKAAAVPPTEEFSVNSTPYAVPVYERFGFVATGPRVEMNGIAFVPMKTVANPGNG
jgi:GNAT superfamily N-acetyltransferase